METKIKVYLIFSVDEIEKLREEIVELLGDGYPRLTKFSDSIYKEMIVIRDRYAED